MRILAIILGIYISTFALCPAVKQVLTVLAPADVCCMKPAAKKAQDKQVPEDCCCNGTYTTCLVYHKERTVVVFAVYPQIVSKIIPGNEALVSWYTSDCWHPPQFA